MRLFDVLWNGYIIIGLMVKVNDDTAVRATEMVVIGDVGIIPSRFSVSLNELDDPDFGIGQQRSIYRIQRDIRNPCLDSFMQGLCIGMVF